MTPCDPQPAFLMLQGWTGLEPPRKTATPILVVGMTPTRYWITPASDKPVALAGHGRCVQPGKRAMVPNYAVSFGNPQDLEPWAQKS